MGIKNREKKHVNVLNAFQMIEKSLKSQTKWKGSGKLEGSTHSIWNDILNERIFLLPYKIYNTHTHTNTCCISHRSVKTHTFADGIKKKKKKT